VKRERERDWRGGRQAGRCGTDCNSIVQKTAGHKQTLTCSSPLALSFTLSSPLSALSPPFFLSDS